MSKLKTEKSYNPEIGFEFFYSDPCGDGFVYFRLEQERDDAVIEAISDYLQDGWNEEVESITVGKITGAAVKVDVTYSPTDWGCTCNYEIKAVGYVCPTNVQIKVGV